MSTGTETLPFLRACRNQSTDRTPVWLMRQAGRYLPEYRALREKHSFLEVCRTPELAAEATLQPIRRYGFDAAILFSDILILAQAMGAEVEFNPGPVFKTRVDGPGAVTALRVDGVRDATAFVPGAIRVIKEQLAGATPLIGFAGAPFTVGTYLVEGGGSRNFERIKSLLFERREVAAQLMDKLVDATYEYVKAQVDAGADAIMLFDTHAGLLAPEEFDAFAGGPVARVFDRLGAGVPRIYYSNGTAGVLDRIGRLPAEVVGLDFRVDLGSARKSLGLDKAVQGNLDPVSLLGPREQVVRRTRDVLASNAGRPGHIFNLGHGILPTAPLENVEALVRTIREWSPTS